MLRRLYADQPDSFAFTSANQSWAEAQITKYPEGRQASAIIPLLWRAQEQEGWLTRPAIEYVAGMLDLAYIRALEVATFYFMFQLRPVGSVAHVQVCGTLSCMICGAEDLVALCKDRIAPRPHELSPDGRFSWEEVECLGACANAPMAQIGKDYYEDLTTGILGDLLDRMTAGEVPVPGPQQGRYAAEPASGLTSLADHAEGRAAHNASVALAVDLGDTLHRIDGTGVPLTTPWQRNDDDVSGITEEQIEEGEARPAKDVPVDVTGVTEQQAAEKSRAKPPSKSDPVADDVPSDGNADHAAAAPDGGAGASGADRDPATSSDTPQSPTGGDATAPGGRFAVGATDDAGEADAGEADAGDDDAADDSQARADSAEASRSVPGRSTAPAPSGTFTPSDAPGTAIEESAPLTLDAPRGGSADNLKRILGVGPKLERTLNDLGIWHFDQIAAWGPAEIAWVDARVSFKGRIERDDWVSQAAALAAED